MRVTSIFFLFVAFLVSYNTSCADVTTAIPDAKLEPSSTSISVDDRLGQLEKTVKELKDKRKDAWDKFQILASLLIPASITLVGLIYTNALKKLEIERTESRSTSEQRIAEINARVQQAELLSTFMEALLSDEPRKRTLAARAISFALPEKARELLTVIAHTDPDETVRRTARESLLEEIDPVGRLIFSGNAVSRDKGEQMLRSYSSYNQGDMATLMDYARDHIQDIDGLKVLLRFIDSFPVGAWKASMIYRDAWDDFYEQLKEHDDAQIRELSEKLNRELE